MASPWQKYRLAGEWQGEFTVSNAEQLDEMLEDIYSYLGQSPLGTSTEPFDWGVLGLAEGLMYIDSSAQAASISSVATGNALISSGVNTIPAWGKIALTTHVSGILPVANGGTNSSSFTAGSIVFAGTSGTTLTQDNTQLFWENTGNVLGIGINTSLLAAKLHVSGAVNVLDLSVLQASSTSTGLNTDFAHLLLHNPDTTVNNYSSLYFTSNHANATILYGASIQGVYTAHTTGAGSAELAFRTRNAGTLAERGRFTSGGLTIPAAHALTLTAMTAGSVLFAGASGVVSQDNASFFFDDTANLLRIGAAASPGAGTFGLVFGDGTALGTMASNTAGLFGEDVGGTVELYAINEANNVVQLTGLNIRKTADESVTNSTTHQDDDHLAVNLAASSSYQFELYGFWTTAGATAGITVQLDGTAGVGSLKADVLHYVSVTDTFTTARITAFNSAVGVAGTGDNSFVIRGVIEVSTAGTFRLEWAQNSADVANATTLQENSYLILRKLNA